MRQARKLFILIAIILFPFAAQSQITVNSTGGTSSATYPTLKLAFDAINFGIHQGQIGILVNSSTTETVGAVLNASGGTASYTKINITPTTACTITGSVAGPLISLNGADSVTIDGRIGGTGTTRSLTLQNTYSSSTVNAFALQLAGGVACDTLRYLTVGSLGSSLQIASSTTPGNFFNTIEANEFRGVGNGTQSAGMSVSSSGATLIYNNLVHDFSSSGILVNGNNCVISDNSLYQSVTVPVTSSALTYIAVNGTGNGVKRNYIGGSAPNVSGTPTIHTGTGTAIGISCAGNAPSLNSIDSNIITNLRFTGLFTGIAITAGVNTIGLSHGNLIGSNTDTGTIRSSGNLTGISVTSGKVNCQNNIIAGLSSFSTITGINCNNTDTVIVSHNTIGGSVGSSINSYGSAQRIYGIALSTAKGYCTQNTIKYLYLHSTAANNGIYGVICNGSATFNQILDMQVGELHAFSSLNTAAIGIGIYNNATNGSIIAANDTIINLSAETTGLSSSAGTFGFVSDAIPGNNTIKRNTITNLHSTTTGSATASAYGIIYFPGPGSQIIRGNAVSDVGSTTGGVNGLAAGISGYASSNTPSGSLTIDSNDVSLITSSAPNTASSHAVAVQGISTYPPVTGAVNILANVVHDISGTATAAISVAGINAEYYSGTNQLTVGQNKVYNLSNGNSTGGTIAGIMVSGSGSTSGSGTGNFIIKNNMVSLTPANNTKVYGILNILPATLVKAYFNSVYIGGTSTGNDTSAAFSRVSYAYTGVDLRDNLFMNVRTGGTAGHYSLMNGNFLPTVGWNSSNYNNLYSSNPNTLALWGSSSLSFSAYQAASLKDSCSLNQLVDFVNPAGGDLHLQNTPNNYNLAGFAVAGINNDIDGNTRNSFPSMGADELLLPYQGVTITASGPTSICNGDSVILSSSVPTGIQWLMNGAPISGANSASLTVHQGGTYSAYYPNGCLSDTSNAIAVTIHPLKADTFSALICYGATYQLGPQTLTTGGTYTQLFSTTFGCDSLVTINLSVKPQINTAVTLSGSILTAIGPGTYQWYDCGTQLPLLGATAQSFTPITSGYFAVIVTLTGCKDTSDCIYTTALGIDGIASTSGLLAFPNPFTNKVNISGIAAGDRLLLYDNMGRKVLEVTVDHTTGQKFMFEPKDIPTGHYLLHIIDKNGKGKKKVSLIKE